ncbi:ADP-ribose pyrophosphatase [Leptolyngbya sp. PCC 7375]|nr:ADP-ribose pyrophosphatase [Leptolyngbya sp. PCC 7375]
MSTSTKEYCYKYPRSALAVDCLVFGLDEDNSLKLLLIQRSQKTFKGKWALPGGFVQLDKDASLEAAARRVLRKETGIDSKGVFLEQLYTFGSEKRDPREWTTSVIYYALINLNEYKLKASTDASDVQWFVIDNLPSLAFDHTEIVEMGINRIRGKVRYQPIGFELLPKKFTLGQLQTLYETILNEKLDRRNFFRKLRKMDIFIELEEFQEGVSHRPAKLYQFDEQKYKQLKKKGFNFEI